MWQSDITVQHIRIKADGCRRKNLNWKKTWKQFICITPPNTRKESERRLSD